MGYRLEIYTCKYTDCGGKLYGYVDDEELYELKVGSGLTNVIMFIKTIIGIMVHRTNVC